MQAKNVIPSNWVLLDKIIEILIEERVFKVAYEKTRETTEYDNWVTESIALSTRIAERLEVDRNLFDQYEELSSWREGELLKNTYEQGFRDGIELLKELLII